MSIALTLPYPPSVNSAYRAVPDPRTGGVRQVKSRAVRAFERDAGKACLAAGALKEKVPDGALSLSLTVYMPDARRRDVSNTIKVVEDAIARALRFDDSRICELHVYKKMDRSRPRVEAVVSW